MILLTIALLAQEASGEGGVNSGTIVDFIQYGVLGLVVFGFIMGWIVPGNIYDKRVEEHKATQADVKELENTIKERVLPALLKSTDVLAEVLALLDDIERERRRERQ